MNLIVVSHLTTNEGLYFRYLTMTVKSYLGMDVLVEAQKEQIDYYYKLLKRKGLYDYVSEILSPDTKEEGIRLDTELNYPLTVTTKNISVTNVNNLIMQIKFALIWENRSRSRDFQQPPNPQPLYLNRNASPICLPIDLK
jgi:hypothetical protein